MFKVNLNEFYKNFSEKDFENREKEILKETREEIENESNQIKWVWVAFGKNEKTANVRQKILIELKQNLLIKNMLVGIQEPVNCMHSLRWRFISKTECEKINESVIEEIRIKLL